MQSDQEQAVQRLMWLRCVLTLLTALGSMLILGQLISYSDYGLDFTDESFYLVWMTNPFNYSYSVTQFGFVYHPLFAILGYDISAIRMANFLITFALAWYLTVLAISYAVGIRQFRNWVLQVASAGIAVSVLTVFDTWLPTPNYNTLALQGILIASIGLLLVVTATVRFATLGWIAVGLGGWLTFMAKPSSALMLAPAVAICSLFTKKATIRSLLVAVLSALLPLLASAIVIDGSILGFVERLRLGVKFAGLLGGGHTVERMFRLDHIELGTQPTLLIPLITTICVTIAWGTRSKTRWQSVSAAVGSCLLFLLTAGLCLQAIPQKIYLGSFKDLLFFAVVTGSVLIALMSGGIHFLKNKTSFQWAMAMLFLIMPHVLAFGTNRNYWQAGGAGAIFWLLSGIMLLNSALKQPPGLIQVLPLALATQVVTAAVLESGFQEPYRQPQPLSDNRARIEIGTSASILVLSREFADYISQATTVAKSAGFSYATPVIDLTGQSPGILYSIGAKSIGQAWTIGGYPGSEQLARAALRLSPCEDISSAWVLFEPEGPRSLPAQILSDVGAAFPSSYKMVGSWSTAPGAGGYDQVRRQELYKPKRPASILSACESIRSLAKRLNNVTIGRPQID